MGDWREKVEAAHDMVSALCRREREWVMSIPARPDYDPDFVITNALIAAKKHIAVLEAKCAELQRRLDAVRMHTVKFDCDVPEDAMQDGYTTALREVRKIAEGRVAAAAGLATESTESTEEVGHG